MDPAAVTTLFTYGPLGIIAWVFFTGYFDDKKRSEAFDAKRMKHEKSMAVIIAEATQASCWSMGQKPWKKPKQTKRPKRKRKSWLMMH